MAVAGKLAVKKRSQHGSNQCRKLRQEGIVPGNIYGHKQAAVAVTTPAGDITALIRGGARVLDIDVEGAVETAIIREIQWDYLGKEIVHFDLVRVDPNEKLEVEVKVELKGTAPGVLSAAGVLDHTLRTLTVECLAIQIPDSIIVKIHTLEVGQAIHVREIEVPPNTRILNNPEDIVVRVAQHVEVAPAAGGEEGPAQPEVIGKKPTDEEESASAEKKK